MKRFQNLHLSDRPLFTQYRTLFKTDIPAAQEILENSQLQTKLFRAQEFNNTTGRINNIEQYYYQNIPTKLYSLQEQMTTDAQNIKYVGVYKSDEVYYRGNITSLDSQLYYCKDANNNGVAPIYTPNIFIPTQYSNKSNIGVTYSCNTSTQEYTLNGTTVSNGDLLLESSMLLAWEPGEAYTMTIIPTGGSATLGDGTGITFSFSIFSMDNTKYMRGSLNNDSFANNISFTGNAIPESGGVGFKFYLQLWRTGTTFNNYKFKVQIEKGKNFTGYKPYIYPSETPWIYLGLRGDQGYPGLGTTLKGIYDSNVLYNEKDVVSYNNQLWIATQSFMGNPPGENSIYWSSFLNQEMRKINMQNTNLKVGDILWMEV